MKKLTIQLSEKDLKDLLGVQKFNYGEIEEENRIGVVTGLAWTEVGGEILKLSPRLCQVKENANNWKIGGCYARSQ